MSATDQLRKIAARLDEVAFGLSGVVAQEAHRLAKACDALAGKIDDSSPSSRSPTRH
jgi:hypothetical protein